jgi:two-component system, NarL family, invasion response regulator UvrY
MPNIFLVDDHILIRDALAKLINEFDACTVVGTASNGKELITAVQEKRSIDIVLLDLSMPVMDGFKTATWLRQHAPHIKVLILSMYDSEVALIQLLKVGVRGFLKKDILANDLKQAIETVANEGYYYCNASTGKLASFFAIDKSGKSHLENTSLTEQEIKFLQLAATDKTYKEIAGNLGMTLRSIDNTRDKLFGKLDVKSRVGLAIYAVKSGIITF